MDDLEALAGQVRRSLHWAAFLLLMMAVILVIDLQLKKQIAKQAVEVSRWLGEMRYGGPAPATAGDPAADAGGDHGVGGDARLAAESTDSPPPPAGPQDNGTAGVPVRAPGNGRRTQRPRGRG